MRERWGSGSSRLKKLGHKSSNLYASDSQVFRIASFPSDHQSDYGSFPVSLAYNCTITGLLCPQESYTSWYLVINLSVEVSIYTQEEGGEEGKEGGERGEQSARESQREKDSLI